MSRSKQNNINKPALIVTISISSLLILFALCGGFLTGFLKSCANFFVGSFGMSFFGILIAVIVGCSLTLSGKKMTIPSRYISLFVLLFCLIIVFVQVLTSDAIFAFYGNDCSYKNYVKCVYNYYDLLPSIGGVVFGSVAFLLRKLLTNAGAIALLVIAIALVTYFIADFLYRFYTGQVKLDDESKGSDADSDNSNEESKRKRVEQNPARQQAMEILFPASDANEGGKNEPKPSTSIAQSPAISPERILFGEDYNNDGNVSSHGFWNDESNNEETSDDNSYIVRNEQNTQPVAETPKDEKPTIVDGGYITEDTFKNNSASGSSFFSDDDEDENELNIDGSKPLEDVFGSFDEEDNNEVEPVDIYATPTVPVQNDVNTSANDDDEPIDIATSDDLSNEVVTPQPVVQEEPIPVKPVAVKEKSKPAQDTQQATFNTTYVPVDGKYLQGRMDFADEGNKEEKKPLIKYQRYEHPPLELFNDGVIEADTEANHRLAAAEAIVKKFKVFGIDVKALEPIVGPSVTRYQFEPLSDKVKMSEYQKFSDDLKACLESEENINILAPIPGTKNIGIEVANKHRSNVMLKNILESDEFRNGKGDLIFAIGQQIDGKVVVADLSVMPHMLIAGSTGSGKSVTLHNLVVSLMYKYSPEYLRFIIVDPKKVEFNHYNNSPHMLIPNAITEPRDAVAALDYLTEEMNERYKLFSQYNVTNIAQYNATIDTKTTQKMYYIVLVVDELAKLMASNSKVIEARISELAFLARAAGIHIILSTQSPRKEVVTGSIKSNMNVKIALRTSDIIESKIIMDYGGAEKLLGRGDMLFCLPGTSVYKRIQSAYISTEEIASFVTYLNNNVEHHFDTSIEEKVLVSRKDAENQQIEQEIDNGTADDKIDPLCKKALRYWLEKNKGIASISSIQRVLGIGFNRAGRIREQLTDLGYIESTPDNETNSKGNKVLVTLDELDDLFPDLEG